MPHLPVGAPGPPHQHMAVKDTCLQGTYCGRIFLRFSFRFYPCFLPFPFIFGNESIYRGGCFPHRAQMPPQAVASSWISWCKKTPTETGLMYFWGKLPQKKVIHINISMWEKIAEFPILLPIRLKESFMLLTHRIAHIPLFWPQCCGHLVTLRATFRKREKVPKLFNLCAKNPTNLEKIFSLELQD